MLPALAWLALAGPHSNNISWSLSWLLAGWHSGGGRGKEGKVICPTGALSQPTYIHLTMLTYLVHTQITHGRMYGYVVKIMNEIVPTTR